MTAARSGRASGIPLSRSGHAENIPPEACFGDALAPIGRQRLSLGLVPLPHSPSRGFSFCHPSRRGAAPPAAACLVYGLGHLPSLPLRTLPAPFPRCRTESRPQPLVLPACAMQCGASAIASPCIACCSALRWPVQRAAFLRPQLSLAFRCTFRPSPYSRICLHPGQQAGFSSAPLPAVSTFPFPKEAFSPNKFDRPLPFRQKVVTSWQLTSSL